MNFFLVKLIKAVVSKEVSWIRVLRGKKLNLSKIKISEIDCSSNRNLIPSKVCGALLPCWMVTLNLSLKEKSV